MKALPDISKTAVAGRLAALLSELEGAVNDLPADGLLDLFAALERVRMAAQLRFLVPATPSVSPALLTVEQVGQRLGGISKAQVYRLAKTRLRTAVVEVGEGTLRFDPGRVERFVESRRRP